MKKPIEFIDQDYKNAYLKIDAEQEAGVSLSLSDLQDTLIEERNKRVNQID